MDLWQLRQSWCAIEPAAVHHQQMYCVAARLCLQLHPAQRQQLQEVLLQVVQAQQQCCGQQAPHAPLQLQCRLQ